MRSDRHCIQCGAELPSGDPDRPCPACGLDPTRDDDGGDTAAASEDLVSTQTARARGKRKLGTIGPYSLLRVLGEGGMGIVYLARQKKPIERQVAIKVIRIGRESRHAVARFEAESQALALMDHPNIAKVIEVGETDEERPYFVMEYVPGVPLTNYCDRHRLTMWERIRLFAKVCDAIQHAHQKGVIHRDIKPSNVLVAGSTTGGPEPKVIDFGVAKATARPLTDRTLVTQFGQVLGTPEYMSPEQATHDGLGVDTRTDVYSLGVLLYELLTGTLPFDSAELRQASYDEVRRRIREEEPPKPSLRISALGEASDATARNRRTDPRALRRRLRGDLDWIVMKALEKDPARRYASASELAADVERHLRNEPVTAGPPGIGYRVGKFVRRHRTGVGVAALIVVLLVGFAAVSAEQARRIARERDRANTEASTANEVSGFLVDLFRRPDPAYARGHTITALEILETGAERLRRLETRPSVRARLLGVVGEVNQNLGLYPQAEVLLRDALDAWDALDAEDPEALRTANRLALLYRSTSRFDEAERLFLQTLERQRRVLGESDPEMLSTMTNLAELYRMQGRFDEAERLFDEVIAARERVLGPEHATTLNSVNGLALLYRFQGRIDEAEALYVRVLDLQRRDLGADHPWTLLTMNNLASLYQSLGRLREAETLYVEALGNQRRVLGDEHSETLNTMNNLATLYQDLNRNEEAEALQLRALEGRRKVLGEDHRDTLSSKNNLATLYDSIGRYEDAKRLYSEVLEAQRRLLGAEHWETLTIMSNLAKLHTAMGRHDEAEEGYRKVIDGRRRVLGPEHPDTLRSMNDLAISYRTRGRLDLAEESLLEVLDARRRVLGEEHVDTLTSRTSLALLYRMQGRLGDARSEFEGILATARRALGDDHPRTLRSLYYLAGIEAMDGEREKALDLLREATARGYRNPRATQDPSLDSLRGAGEFETLLATLAGSR